MIIDTQIISYRFKGQLSGCIGSSDEISSVTASEFLLSKTNENNKPDYYVLHPTQYPYLTMFDTIVLDDHFKNPKLAKLRANRTDSFTIDFNNQFPPYKIFGNEAISEIINTKNYALYKLSIAHLSKKKQKYLKKRMEFVFDSDFICHPVNESIIQFSMQLYFELEQKYNFKDNIKNSINDLLILSTACLKEKTLFTEDKLLNVFAAEKLLATVSRNSDGIILDFSTQERVESRISTESKGYINRGWSYSVRHGNNVQGT